MMKKEIKLNVVISLVVFIIVLAQDMYASMIIGSAAKALCSSKTNGKTERQYTRKSKIRKQKTS